MTTKKFKLLALDVDGTLVGPDGMVRDAVRQAVTDARAAGLGVCLATGRSHIESRGVWRQLNLKPPYESMVTVGGAVVREADTGRTLYHRSIPRDAANRFGQALNDHGSVAMALVDGWRHDADYLITESGDHHAASRDWFGKMDVRLRRVANLAEAPPEMPILRISAVMEGGKAQATATELARAFGDELNVHAILAPNYGVTIVEAHAPGADKMTALRYVAQPMLIGPGHIAAVGDDINDVPMIRGAGLGAAMDHAPEAVRQVADVVVPGGRDGDGRAGLAEFIGKLVAGEYDALAKSAGIG